MKKSGINDIISLVIVKEIFRMLDINKIKNEKEKIISAIAKRGITVSLDQIITLDEERRKLLQEIEQMKAERNKVSASVPTLKKEGKNTDEVFAKMRALGDKIEKGDNKVKEVEAKLNDELAALPNIPDDDIVAGGKENNKAIEVFGKKPEFKFKPKDHVELCTSLGLVDYERAVKLSGSGFCAYRDMGARLEWAMLNFFIDEHIASNYEFVMPPHVLQNWCGFGAGQFPKFSDEVFSVNAVGQTADRFLLPTAEAALVNLYAGEIIPGDELPKKFFAYTPCFRTEIGSYRAEERGMVRGHQFNKVEMVQITTPEKSAEAFDEILAKAADLVKKLGLHFQISKLAAGDISASMTRTYDIEVWIPSMGVYKEVSSASCTGEYQARRNNTKFRDSNGKTQYVHMLNGSGLATSRLFPALVEQLQNEDGSVNIPEVLQKYMGGAKVISPKKVK